MKNLFPLLIVKKINVNVLLTLLFSFNFLLLQAQTGGIWNDVDENLIPTNGTRQIIPTAYRTLKLQVDALRSTLATAPSEEDFESKTGAPMLDLPMPDGSTRRFKFAYSPIMQKTLADLYPEIKTYIGQGIEDPSSTIRFDITPRGFHAIIFSSEGTVFIDPYHNNSIEYYISYFKRDFIKNETDRITCSFNGGGNFRPNTNEGLRVGDCGIRHEYRLAVSATGEYTTFHGGTVALAMAAIVTTMNRVNGVFEKDIAVRMILIANNSLIVYTNAGSDPFTNGDPNAMINENQTNTDLVIGNANYDIGHVFGTNSGGLAGLGVVCNGPNKARGVTGSAAPVGDPFDIDYVAHEIGHQFNGNHTQYNDACNRNNGTAVEPGSASTIMGYAGVCTPFVQNNSDAYFSTASLFEMRPFVVGNTCDAEMAVANTSPSVSAVSNYSIPISTPFLLTASATDANGSLTYCWEQINTWVSPTQTMPPVATNVSGPVFRSLTPVVSPSRYFPNLTDVLNNAPTVWEVLPSVGRALNFRVTVRDNVATAGCTGEASNTVTTVAAAGPFLVTSPNTAVTLVGNSMQTITWNVAGTTAAPINCANVDILLTTNGGMTFTTLLAATPNDGSQSVTIPNTATTTARIWIKCSDNIFYDVSNVNFTIIAAIVPCTELYFSEYVEGSSNNKAIEIFNPTATAVTLTGNYQIKIYFNGSASAGSTINLTGTIAPFGVFVVANTSASAPILGVANQTSGSLTFNGNDAVELFRNTTSTRLDVIGQIGFDPGTEWGSGLTSTMDNTLRRKTSIGAGDNNGSDAFVPATEWDGFATDDFTGLGAYVSVACAQCPVLTSAPNNVSIINSTCTNCVLAGGMIMAPTTNLCPVGATLQYSVDNGTSWSATLPVYSQAGPAQTIITRCNCDANINISSPSSVAVTSSPGTCPLSCSCPPLITAPNNVTISNSTCINCMLGSGLIGAPSSNLCPVGSTLQYSVDNGTTWSMTVPVYDQDGPAQTIITRCNCNVDTNISSPSSSPVTTIPGMCPASCLCPPLITAPDNVTISNSTCVNCIVQGGVITAPTSNVCPVGSTLQYSTNGGSSWSTSLPIYDQDGPAQTIITRCNCDINTNISSPSSTPVSTIPASCSDPIPTVDQPANQVVCDSTFTMPVNFTGSIPGTIYNWSNDNTSIGLGASGTGNISAFMGTNSSNVPIVGNITVTPTLNSQVMGIDSFNFTGGMQTFTVPAGVTSINITAYGASGGNGAVGGSSALGGPGGLGAKTTGTLSVVPGQVLNIFVGGQGATPAAGFNGGANGGSQNAGGGGGASDVRVGGVAAINRVITAGGGGGGGRGGCIEVNGSIPGNGGAGGLGGSGIGVMGGNSTQTFGGGVAGGGFGGNLGSVQGAFGPKGIGCAAFSGQDGFATSSEVGGVGGGGQNCCCGAGNSIVGGGGGGGGQIGGGGGGGGSAGTTGCSGNSKGAGGGGGGGSSYIGGVQSGVLMNGVQAGNGLVIFEYIQGVAGCTGLPKTFTITVNPKPNAVATPASQTKCSGFAVTPIVLSGNVAGTIYNWTRDNVVAATGIAASGAGNISGTLINTTTAAVTVTFTITPSYTNGGVTCTGYPVTATVLVNPTPTVDQPANQVVCDSIFTLPVNFTGFVPGTVYNWSNSNTSIGLGASGLGNIPAFMGTNSSNVPIVGSITVTPTLNSQVMGIDSFNFTGGMQTFTVPAGVTSINISAYGASGGNGAGAGTFGVGAQGGFAKGTLTVTPGQVLNIFVGGAATSQMGGFNGGATGGGGVGFDAGTGGIGTGGGGGGASDIRVGGIAIGDRVLVAGGGGGGGTNGCTQTNGLNVPGGAGGGGGGVSGFMGTNSASGGGGFGGSVGVGGAAGIGCGGFLGMAGSNSGTGGNGQGCCCQAIPAGGGGGGGFVTGGGGGGGSAGTTGCSGNDKGAGGGGGGGSSYIGGVQSGVLMNGVQAGNGLVIIDYNQVVAGCTGLPKTFTITVNPKPNAIATPASQTKCSGVAITPIVLSGNVAGTIYNWTRDNVVAATGIAGSGAGNISGTLTNTTTAPVTVTFTITPSYSNAGVTCTGYPVTATVLVNPTPTAVATPATQTKCSGVAITTIVLTGSVSGTTYNWTRDNTVAVTGITASGAGNISGTLINTTAAPVTVTFTITPTANGCPGTAITATVLVNPTPTATATPASQTKCSGVALTTIVLTGAVSGTTFDWVRDNTATVTGIPASGSGDISGTLTNTTTSPITVTFTITPTANGCLGTPITATVLVNPTPIVGITVAETSGVANNDAIICVGASTTLTASGGGTYVWSTGGSTNAITVAPTMTTTYTVTVTATTGCTNTATQTITVNPLPTLFTVTGGGARCNTDDGLPVGLSGSQTGVNYQLQLNGTNTGTPVAGTGSALAFPVQSLAGTYTVIATSVATGCSTPMTGNVVITIFNCTSSITDPCVCLNNATTNTNGQFSEAIVVNAPATQVWIVSAVSGLYTSTSPAPPAAPILITVGTVLTPSGTTFTLNGRHIESIGYTISVTNSRGTTFTIGNTCSYPDAMITNLPLELCLGTSVPLTGNPGDANIISSGFTVNGVPATIFNPPATGNYTVVYTVNGGLPKAFGPTDPGCIQAVSQIVGVFPVPEITKQPRDIGLCIGASGSFTLTATVAAPSTLTYQWQQQINGTWVNIAGATSSTLPIVNVNANDNNERYRCIVTALNANGFGCPIFSDVVILHVHETIPMTCVGHINFSLDANCEATNFVDIFLNGNIVSADFYEVIIKNGNVVIALADVKNYLGKVLTYQVRDICDNNSCWGTVRFEDKLPPVIDCGPEITIPCYQVAAFLAENITNVSFRPVYSDACGPITAVFTTEKSLAACEGGYIIRRWTVTDGSGNKAYCEQRFNISNRVTWSCPQTLVLLTCKDDTSPEGVSALAGVEAAYPYFVNGMVSIPINGVCNYFTTYSDIEFEACGPHCHGNKKVIRKWTILDWCAGTVSECTQIIKAIDLEAPTFILKDTIVSTRPWDCTGDFYLPNPWELHDNCDANPTWEVVAPEGVWVVKTANGWRASNVPCGVTGFTYVATDCCGNKGTGIVYVTVKDRTPPVAVAKRDIVVSLVPGVTGPDGQTDGQAKIFTYHIDNGSFDNCSGVLLEVRRPLGTSCGNDGLVIDAAGNRHNNNRTFSNASNSDPYSANDTDNGAFVKFCCDDLTTAGADFDGDGILDVGYHQVILRVWDDGNKNGIIGEVGKDNWNDTWANVKVECKIPPVITCPADKTIYCDWAIQENVQSGTPGTDNPKAIPVTGVDFTKTGLPTAYGVCVSPIVTFWDKENFNQCDLGFIQRTFIVKDKGFTTTCIQRIDVLQSLTAVPWTFIQSSLSTTPIPLTGAKACEGPTAEDIKSKGPKYTSGPCDVIGVTTNVEQFDFEDGVCRKWRVEYKYFNWCTNEERGPYYKYWIFEDTKAPEMTCRDTMFGVGPDCSLVVMISKKAVDTSGCINTGWLKWEVYVDLWADGQEDLLFSSFYFGAEGAERFVNGSIVKQYKLSGPQTNLGGKNATSSGQELKITLPFPIVGKMSNHKVVWKVTDGCHNFTSCHETFMVVDKKAPTPVCIPLTTALMADPDGSGPALPMVELWACDFMNKAYDNCSASEDLLYTFENIPPQVTDKVVFGRLTNIDIKHYFDATGALSAFPAISSAEKAIEAKYLRGEGGIQLWDPETGCSAKVWSSNVLTPGQAHTDVDVRVTVWDKKFNYDFCWTTLSLICNTCEGIPASFVKGNVSTEGSQGVRNVQIIARANLPEYPKTEMTDINGNYEMPILAQTELEAFKDGDDINGVSTLDLVMIQRHILGIQPLSSPYKIIAADANNDGKVTASDLTEIRKLILGITVDYPYNTSWRFPALTQTMDPTNPFPYAEKMPVQAGIASVCNFVGVKIGDVNGNASTNVLNPTVEGRTSHNVGLVVTEAAYEAGSTVSIPVTAANFKDVFGYQFTMNLNGASLVEVQSGAIEVNGSNVGILKNDVVTMSFVSKEGVTVNEDETLFTVVVKANKAGNVSEMISLNSTVTPAESYVGDVLAVGKVSLAVRTAPVASIELFQNQPNPFKGQTTVSFNMSRAAQAVITVTDVTGKVITVRKADATKGFNSEIFTREQLGASGILFYTLTSGDFTATKKMIIVE